jgi:peptidoglycan/LPS O-acetylase OafA/YrhL
MFAIYCVLVLALHFEPDRRGDFIENIPFVIGFYPEYGTFHSLGYLPPPFSWSWSIGIEEKFYFVWPVLVFVLLRIRPKGTAVAIFVGGRRVMGRRRSGSVGRP